ncbi:MAG: hypothetical protein ACJ8GW_11710 [Massilia sp.]
MIEPSANGMRAAFSTAGRDQIAHLEQLGYVVYKEWGNGVELRKKTAVSDVGFALRCLCILCVPVLGMPFFGRAVLDVLCGFKFRAFVPNSSAQIT